MTSIQIVYPVVTLEFKYMGGVDKSDQYMAYQNPFYHLIDIALVNAFIFYNILQIKSGRKVISVISMTSWYF